MRPLDGVKVLDLSRLLPGPYCSLLLADLGADVVKIESPMGGDYLRWLPPMLGAHGAMFHALNRNKRSVALNLKKTEGRDAFGKMVRSGFDVVLESFRPGVMDRLGIGWEQLAAWNPRTILCSISGYGQDGPMRERAGHDLNYIGIAGVLGYSGTASGPPMQSGVQIGDLGGGSYPAAVGILAAVVSRQSTGEGQWIDISMTDGALAFMSIHLGAQFAGESLARGADTLNGGVPCYGVYETLDGKYMTLGALEPQFWQRFCEVVGLEELVAESLTRGEEGATVRAKVAEVFASRTREEWIAVFAEHDCCCEPVWEAREVADDPQLQARGMFIEVEDPEADPVRAVATPVRFVDAEAASHAPAPGLGAHTDEILESCGIDEAARTKLREAGAIG